MFHAPHKVDMHVCYAKQNYAKFLWLYLQQMNNLEHNSSQVYQDFMAGYHVVC